MPKPDEPNIDRAKVRVPTFVFLIPLVISVIFHHAVYPLGFSVPDAVGGWMARSVVGILVGLAGFAIQGFAVSHLRKGDQEPGVGLPTTAIVRTGMIARTGTEIPLENINNVLFSQRVIERILRYGDVLVESAGSQGQSRLEDIPDPEAFQSEIYRAREQRSLHFSGSAARDIVAQLEALARLHERGHLSDAEFAAKKAKLLGGAMPAGEVETELD
jgi:hypothetical protein